MSRETDEELLRLKGITVSHGISDEGVALLADRLSHLPAHPEPPQIRAGVESIDVPGLLELIEEYGYECAAGGAGYTSDRSDEILVKIKQRLGVPNDDQ